MQFLSRLRLGPRLGVAFGALILGAACVIIYGITRISTVTDSLSLIGQDRVPKVQEVVKVSDQLNLIARELRNTLIFTDESKISASLDITTKARDDIAAILDKLEPTIRVPEGVRLMGEVNKQRASFLPLQAKFVDLVRAGKREEAGALLADQLRPAQLSYMQALNDLKQFQIDLIDTAVKDGEANYQRDRAVMYSLLGLLLLCSGLLAWLIARSVVEPVRRAVDSANRIAQGDLTETLDASGRDETADLLRAISQMQDALRTLVSQVRNGVESVTTASAQIAAGNQDLSSRTEQQASSLQETASSMEQLTSTVTHTAENAKQANQLASSASDAASKGGEVVGQVVSTMERISASSQRIADIIGTIDGIAFQTNILALNAAVEAARAGEQGRGFAVVAAEVRSLAQRSAQAAREIKGLISDSVEKVEAGSKLVHEAGSAMSDIVTQVRRVTDLVGEITSASIEQSSGIGQVNSAVTQMDQVTQQNAALVEESAAAAASLSAQARKLAEVVQVFRLRAGESRPVIAEEPTATPGVHAPAHAHAPARMASSGSAGGGFVERRGPDRAKNVTRLKTPAAPAAATVAPLAAEPALSPAAEPKFAEATGTDDWQSF